MFEAATNAHPWGIRILHGAGLSIAGLAILVPATALGALILTGRDDADASAWEIFQSIPRTLRALYWSSWAAYRYRNLINNFNTSIITEETFRQELDMLHRRAARRLLEACEKNGGVYIKAGQLAVSMQAVPPQYREILRGLEDRVPSRPFKYINRVIKAELGAPADVVFAEFSQQATAAASLAQVHKAKTHDGLEVAVKVQYPGLEGAVGADLVTLKTVAKIVAYLFKSDWQWLVAELQIKLAQELDLTKEAKNATRLAACFAHRSDVRVPAIVDSLSTKRIICMEWITGAKVSDANALRKLGLAPRHVGLVLLDAAAEMMCVHGFVHGDLHPGNVFVQAVPKRRHPLSMLLPWNWLGREMEPSIILLDHGLYFELPEHMRQLYCLLWASFVLNDVDSSTAVAVQLAGSRAGRVLPEVLKPRDWSKVPPEERKKLRNEVGVTGLRDLTSLLNEAPAQLISCLRGMAIVRHIASDLGASVADRMRVNAVQAFNGLRVEDECGRRQYVGLMKVRWNRWKLFFHIFLMRVVGFVSLLVGSQEEEAPLLVN